MTIDYATLRDLTKDGGYLYLATPYSKYEGGIDAAWREACMVAAALIRANVPVYCPIAHTHPIAIHGGCLACYGIRSSVTTVLPLRLPCRAIPCDTDRAHTFQPAFSD